MCGRERICNLEPSTAAGTRLEAGLSKDQQVTATPVAHKGRAVQQMGRILKEIPANKGGRPTETNTGNGISSRREVAEEAGLSKRQKDTALQVASVPEDVFEPQIESPDAPSITALAEQGTRQRPTIIQRSSKIFTFPVALTRIRGL